MDVRFLQFGTAIHENEPHSVPILVIDRCGMSLAEQMFPVR